MTSPTQAPAPAGLDPSWTRQSLQRRVLAVIVTAQVFGGAGLAAGVTVGALLAQDMMGTTGLAGLPVALFTAGSAGAALMVGRVSARHGRRRGLGLGYAAGGLGGAGVALAAVLDNVPLLLLALTVYGSGTATSLQARHAGTDLADPAFRGRAISLVLVATTLGAVGGPNLTEFTGDLAAAAGMPRLAGPFVLAALAYGLAGLVLAVLLRPDPLLAAAVFAARAHANGGPAGSAGGPTGRGAPRVRSDRRTVVVAVTAMVLTQLTMVALMTMTPIHLTEHDHTLTAVGLVISVHVACMFLPSPVTGWLTDTYGRRPVLAAGGLTLVAAGLTAALADPGSLLALSIALGLLGLGWNFGLIAGTALIADATTLTDRARSQGAADLAIALAGATGGLASGGIVAGGSYGLLSLVGGITGLLVLPALLAAPRRP